MKSSIFWNVGCDILAIFTKPKLQEGLAIPVKVVGIPHYVGALVSGTELSPDALRKAGLITQLQQSGIEVEDIGNMQLPDYLPRHNMPPVRNWPAPRMIWDLLQKEAYEWFDSKDFVVMLGGDCSTMVGTALAHKERYGEKAYLVVIDGHFDAVVPVASRSIGAAGMGLWFLLEDKGTWIMPSGWTSDRIKVIGCQRMPEVTYGVDVLTLDELSGDHLVERMTAVMRSIPADAKILVHFDVDVMHKQAMTAAYSPSETGLSLQEAQSVLDTVLSDSRVVGMEVTEFSALRDTDGEQAERLVQLISSAVANQIRAQS
ncbi:arginase family protein [Brevibacillus reuszeri]|uniref:arginase family protein n=1 Tax=Brevibacillus reuszeri TaxID=54915 RepID=UPI0035B567E1